MLQIVAGVAPDRLVGVQHLYIFNKGQQLPLVLRLKRLAAQQRKPIDVTGGQTLQYFIANFLGKRRTVAEIPCHGIEAVRAVAAAAGNEQARAHALPVGNITIFNGCVIHGVLLRGHPHILCRAGVPPPNPDIVYQLWGHTARGSMIFEEDICTLHRQIV